MFHYKPLGYRHFTNLHMIGPYQNVLFFSLCQSLSTCNSFSFSPPLDFGALALGRSWLSWGSLSMENRGKLITVIWNHQAVMKHEKLAKIHRNSPHLEEAVHVSTPKSWTFITSAPKSLTNWVKVYQSSATFTCRPDVHSKILSPVQVRTRKKCEVTKITVGVNIKNKPMSYKSKSNHCVLRESEMEF